MKADTLCLAPENLARVGHVLNKAWSRMTTRHHFLAKLTHDSTLIKPHSFIIAQFQF